MAQGEATYPLESEDLGPVVVRNTPADRTDRGMVVRPVEDMDVKEILFRIMVAVEEIAARG